MEAQEQTSKLIFTPLMISMVGIVFTALAIVTYHFILTKYCGRRRANTVQSESNIERSQKQQIGVEKEILKAIPIFNYSRQRTELFRVDQTECSVCLGDLEEGDMVRLLPNCRHSFHLRCIDEWLVSHSNCPVCRSPIQIILPPIMPILPPQLESELLVIDQQDDIYNDASQSGSGSGSKLQHCVSLVLPNERKNPPLDLVLKRSLSMDYSHVLVKIHGDHHKDSSSSSSSSSPSRADFFQSSLCKVGSFKHLDYASSMVIKSFSRFRRSESNNNGKGILPC